MTAPVDTGALRELVEGLRGRHSAWIKECGLEGKDLPFEFRESIWSISADAITALLAEVERRRADEAELVAALTAAAAELDLAAQKVINLHTLLSRGLYEAADRARSLLAKVKDSA